MRAALNAAPGWAVLALIAWAIVKNGAFAAPHGYLLCLGIGLVFLLRVGLDLTDGVAPEARKAIVPGLVYGAVLVWLLVQSSPAVPAGLLHPVWALAPEGAQPAISAYPDAAWPVAMRLMCYGLAFAIVLGSAAADAQTATWFIRAIALFSTGLALYGLYAKATGVNPLFSDEELGGVMRASFWNRNAYATVAVFGVLANITAYARAIGQSTGPSALAALRHFLEAFFAGAWIYAFGALVGLGALAMTLSRGGALAGAVGVVVLLLALGRGRERPGLAVPVGLAVFAALFLSAGVVERAQEVPVGGRAEVFGQTWAAVTDRPLLGHGAGTFHDAFRPYAPLSQARWDWEQAHNSYLENAFEFGLPAAGVFYFALALIGWRLWQGVRTRRRHQAVPAFALACFAAAATHATVDFTLQYPANAALFAAILGLGWSQSFPRRDRARGRRGGRSG